MNIVAYPKRDGGRAAVPEIGKQRPMIRANPVGGSEDENRAAIPWRGMRDPPRRAPLAIHCLGPYTPTGIMFDGQFSGICTCM